MKTFIIKRSKWARGGINGLSMLLNSQGNKCCLGFLATDGNPAGMRLIKGTFDPAGAINEHPRSKTLRQRFTGLFTCDFHGRFDLTRLARSIIDTNDKSFNISEKLRESRLTKMFAKLGWKPKFID